MLVIPYMLLHSYLEEIVGSKVSIRIARAIVNNPGKLFTVRKLAQTAKVSTSEAASIVQQLEKYGVLRIQPVGRSYLLTINEESYILKAVLKPLIGAEKGTFDILVSILQTRANNDKILSATLFGSVASGEEREDSDIDLLVVSDDFDAATAYVAESQEKLSELLSGRFSPLIMSKKELFKKKDDPLVQSMLHNYVTVVGKDLKEIVTTND